MSEVELEEALRVLNAIGKRVHFYEREKTATEVAKREMLSDLKRMNEITAEASKKVSCEGLVYTFEDARRANEAIFKGTATINDLKIYLCYLRHGTAGVRK